MELFHVNADLSERYDLSELEVQRAADLTGDLDGWLRRVEANMPTANPSFDPAEPSGRLPPDER